MQQHTDSSAAIDFISQFNNTSPNMLSYHAQGGMACMPNDPYQQYNAHTMAMADLQGSEPQQAFPSLTPLAEQLAALQSQHQLIASLQSHQNVLTEQLLPLYNLGDLIAPANAGLSFEAAELLAFKAGFRGPCNPAVVSPGATTNPLYKTELCRSWEETGTCRYGGKCQFAHGREELRPVQRHPKYKTECCRTFATTGTCPYGTRCRFIHANIGASNFTSAASTPRGMNLATDSPQAVIAQSNSAEALLGLNNGQQKHASSMNGGDMTAPRQQQLNMANVSPALIALGVMSPNGAINQAALSAALANGVGNTSPVVAGRASPSIAAPPGASPPPKEFEAGLAASMMLDGKMMMQNDQVVVGPPPVGLPRIVAPTVGSSDPVSPGPFSGENAAAATSPGVRRSASESAFNEAMTPGRRLPIFSRIAESP